jgi:tetratricopeptide (TPR) repeat protein
LPGSGDDDDDDGGSGTAGGNSSNGTGSGGGLPLTQVQKDLFFQTSEFFELTRGQDSSFAIKFTNPLKYKLVKLNLQVSGILSSYLKLKESYIPTLDVNGEFNTAIEIVSPKYFNPGKYDLTFKITGFFLNDYNKEISFTEERAIKLYIHDVNKEEAEIYLGKMQEFIESLRKENFKLNNLPELFGDANALFYARDYDAAKMKFELAQEIYNSVIDAELRSRNISGLISYANSQGLATPNTNRLLVLAELAIKRGDYALALSRLKEAELTYTIETKGEINLFIFALANIDRIILIIILGVIAFYLFSLGYGMIKINRQLSDYNAENNLLLSMIAGIQKKSFVENKMSLGEYYDALGQFENRIAVVSEKIIQLTTRKNNMLTFSTPSTKLRKEKASLLDLIKQTQKQYFNMGLIETRVYQTKVESLTKRLSEVDEDIVSSDLRKTIRLNQKGVLKYFWKLYYRVFK